MNTGAFSTDELVRLIQIYPESYRNEAGQLICPVCEGLQVSEVQGPLHRNDCLRRLFNGGNGNSSTGSELEDLRKDNRRMREQLDQISSLCG